MATTVDEPAQKEKGLFVRNSTGLVRELSGFDAMNLVLAAVLLPIGITQIMGFTPVFWPHANMFVAFLIATPLVTCFALVYLYFTVLMPRAGGDYVWVSRVLSPGLGFVCNFSLTFVYLTWVSLNFTLMYSILAPSFGYVAGINSSFFMSPSKGDVMLVATVATVVFTGLMMLGVRRVARYMAIMFAIIWIGMGIWFALMLFGSHAGFVARWNAHSGATVTSIINQASKLGFSSAGGIGWIATLFGMIYCFQVYPGCSDDRLHCRRDQRHPTHGEDCHHRWADHLSSHLHRRCRPYLPLLRFPLLRLGRVYGTGQWKLALDAAVLSVPLLHGELPAWAALPGRVPRAMLPSDDLLVGSSGVPRGDQEHVRLVVRRLGS